MSLSSAPYQSGSIAFSFFNGDFVNQSIKLSIGSFSFLFGILQLKKLGDIAKRDDKVTLLARVSLIISGAVTPIGLFLISKIEHVVFKSLQLTQVFGPNTIFQINPYHSRHVFSFVAVGLSLPFIARTIVQYVKQKIHETKSNRNQLDRFTKLSPRFTFVIFLNALTSMPVLHGVNQIVRNILNCR